MSAGVEATSADAGFDCFELERDSRAAVVGGGVAACASRADSARRARCFFGFLDVDQVGGDDTLGFAFGERLALVEPERAVAELLDQIERMRHQQDGLVAPPELGKLVEALHA